MSVLENNFFNLKKNHQKQHESIMGSFPKKGAISGCVQHYFNKNYFLMFFSEFFTQTFSYRIEGIVRLPLARTALCSS